jgi:hypothetical protein
MDPTTLGAELIKQLATQGLGWLVSCLVGLIAYVFYLRGEKSNANCAAQTEAANMLRDQLQEKRVDEARGYIKVFSEGTSANEKLAQAISVRTETLQAVSAAAIQTQKELVQAREEIARLIALAQDIQSGQNTREAAWQVRLGQIEETTKKYERRIDELVGELRKER